MRWDMSGSWTLKERLSNPPGLRSSIGLMLCLPADPRFKHRSAMRRWLRAVIRKVIS